MEKSVEISAQQNNQYQLLQTNIEIYIDRVYEFGFWCSGDHNFSMKFCEDVFFELFIKIKNLSDVNNLEFFIYKIVINTFRKKMPRENISTGFSFPFYETAATNEPINYLERWKDDENNNIVVLDMDEDSPNYGERVATLNGHEWFVFDMALSPDGKTLASVSVRDTTARLWNIDPESPNFGQQIGYPMQHEKIVDCVVFSPDGEMLITGTINGSIYLWDLSVEPIPAVEPGWYMSGLYKEAKAFPNQYAHPLETLLLGHSGLIESLAFSPDGKILASAGGVTVGGGVGGEVDGTIILWNTDPDSSSFGEQIGETLKGHTAGVMGLSYDPNGGRLASASEDDSIRLWDVDPNSQTFGLPIGDPLQSEDPDPWEVAYA